MSLRTRSRFILFATLCYAVLALAWIFLSDSLLALLTDLDSMVKLSKVKGIFFVIVTSAFFFFALRAVPAVNHAGEETLLGTLAVGVAPGKRPRWLIYAFAVAITLAMLVMRLNMSAGASGRPMLILFMFPIILSALIGGLGPGLLSTALSALSVDFLIMQPIQSFGISDKNDLMQWAFLIGNGIAVSLLSELMRHSLGKVEIHWRLLNAVVSGTSDAIFVKDTQGRYLLANRATAEQFNTTVDNIIGRDDRALFPESAARTVMARDKAIMDGARTQTHEEYLTTLDGKERVYLVTKGPVFDEAGKVNGIFGVARDISDAKRSEAALRTSEERFQMAIDATSDGLWDMDLRSGTIYRSPNYFTLTGYSIEDDSGDFDFFKRLVHPDDLPDALQNIEAHKSGKTAGIEFNFRLLTRAGATIWVRSKGRVVERDEHGTPLRMVGTLSDISKIKAHEAELDQVAHYDPLTGAPNRRLLVDRLSQAIIRAGKDGGSLAVCYLDLDGFKAVNNEHGHAAGDQLLIGVADHLKSVLRTADTLARLGGDEFVLLLTDFSSPEECSIILDRVLNAVNRPVQIAGVPIRISASIGVSLYPADDADADTLLRHANQAMYTAKDGGKNRYSLFDSESDRKARGHREHMALLRQALDQEEFVLHYQPKVDLISGEIVGVEALIRWQHPEMGLLAPAEFLPYVNGSDLEKPFGEWVINSAMAQVESWHAEGQTVCVSVNIGADHLLQADFYDRLQLALERHPNMPAANFEMEVLESAAIADMDQAVAVLHQCRELGVCFALDDFGTGYSSLTHLRKLPANTLKIDQSFVRDMLIDADDLGIVESVIRMADAFNRQVIAEGVETLEHGAALLQLGCRLAQGYGIARPMPAHQFMAWSRAWKNDAVWTRMKGADLSPMIL